MKEQYALTWGEQRKKIIKWSIGNYINRTGYVWTDNETLQDLCFYLNTQCNQTKYDNKLISPYELQFCRKPPVNRILLLEKPNINSAAIQTNYKFTEIASHKNTNKSTREINLKLKIGQKVYYHRKGSKNKEPVEATVHSVDNDTVTLKKLDGELVTRHKCNIIV